MCVKADLAEVKKSTGCLLLLDPVYLWGTIYKFFIGTCAQHHSHFGDSNVDPVAV